MPSVEPQFDYQDERVAVLCIGPPVAGNLETELKQRRLAPKAATAQISRTDFSLCRALLFHFDSTNPQRIVNDIKATYPDALNHGAKRVAVVDTEQDVVTLQALLVGVTEATEMPPPFLATLPFNIAEHLARAVVGPSEHASLEIKTAGTELSPEGELLLRRAFADCKSILVEPLVPGFSTDNVLCVHATLELSNAGPWPLPFFVKIDVLEKVNKELRCYGEFVRFYVPFNLRPDFDSRRKVSGATRGVLVSNFVEDAASLLEEVVERGRGVHALHSLFEDAMRGWRLQGKSVSGNCIEQALTKFKWHEPHTAVVALAETFGARRSPEDLVKLLKARCPLTYFDAPIHGDLHARNVQVRGSDAILIDFLSTDRGPMLWDHAALDVSLMFDGLKKEIKAESEWDFILMATYQPGAITRVPTPVHRTEPGYRRLMATRKVRHYALAEQVSDGEYTALVALQLLRRSGYYDPKDEDPHEYARAYALAEALACTLTKRD